MTVSETMTKSLPASLLINIFLVILTTLAISKSAMTQVFLIVFLYWLYRRFYVHHIRVKLDIQSDLAAIKETSLAEHIRFLKKLENAPGGVLTREKLPRRNIPQRIEFLRKLKKKRVSERGITVWLWRLSYGSYAMSVLFDDTALGESSVRVLHQGRVT